MEFPRTSKCRFGESGIVRIAGVGKVLPRERKAVTNALAILARSQMCLAQFKNAKPGSQGLGGLAAGQAARQARAVVAACSLAEKNAFRRQENSREIFPVVAKRERFVPRPRRVCNRPRDQPQGWKQHAEPVGARLNEPLDRIQVAPNRFRFKAGFC